nr:uncharacterized protein LOC109168900 [Ipomoea batatas]
MEFTISVINAWSCILNHRERTKSPAAPARVFASPLTTINTAVGLKIHNIDAHKLSLFRDALCLDFAIGPYNCSSLSLRKNITTCCALTLRLDVSKLLTTLPQLSQLRTNMVIL